MSSDEARAHPYKPDEKNPPPPRACEGVLREWAIHSAHFPQFYYHGDAIYAIWDKKDVQFFMSVIRKAGESDKELMARVIGGLT